MGGMRLCVGVLSVSWLCGCHCGEPAPEARAPAPAVTPASETAAERADEPAEEHADETEERGPMIDLARADEARAAIREGRRAAHASRWTEALSAFDRALAILPGAPRVRCEAGYVAHRAGDDRRAARDLELALALLPDPASATLPDELRIPLAMCLYNRGLVHEAAHQYERATERYEDSLALRDHPAVRARLDAAYQLVDRTEEGIGPEATAAQVRDYLARNDCGEICDEDDYDDEGQPDPTCSDVDEVRAPEDARWPEGIAIFETSAPGCLVEYERTHLAVRSATGWTFFLLSEGETATTDGFYRCEGSFESHVSVLRMSEHLLRIDLHEIESSRYGDDAPRPDDVSEEDDPRCLADNESTTRTHEIVLCRTDGAVPRCGAMLVGSDGFESRTVYCEEGEDVPDWALPSEPPPEAEEALRDHVELRLVDGAVVLAHAPGTEPLSESEAAPGRYELDALFERVLSELPEASF